MITASVPSDPSSWSIQASGASPPSPTTNGPRVGETARSCSTMSSKTPYLLENWPADRAAAQPPTDEHQMDEGECPRVNPRASSQSSRC